ncbi:MAG: ABC transporter ATP-binding protein [Cyclobacteriaceae bacterium]|nr:MAG: ABC transporter ATP-binding protein [Cyclobacteriaceae bacterium]
MKTYLRILSFARPLSRYLPQYIVFTLLGIIFGLINFTLLKPLFDVIFEQMDANELQAYQSNPSFALSLKYLEHKFYYFFISAQNAYGKIGTLAYISIVTIIANLLANTFRYLSQILLAKVRARTVRGLRMAIYEKLTLLHLGFFTDQRKGDITSRITNDIQEVENGIVQSLQVIFRDPATIILYFGWLFFMSYKLTIFTIILLPVAGLLISGIVKKLRRIARAGQESLGRILNQVDETFSGIRIIKAFNARDYTINKFSKEVNKYAGITVSMARKNELASPVSEFLGIVVVGGILLFGGNLVLNNQSSLDGAAFLTYLVVFTQVLAPAKGISKAYSSIQRALASAERIFEIIDTVPGITDAPHARETAGFRQTIEFKQVSFAYENEWVLQNINLTIPRGSTIALVGPSGSGKSTLVDLIPRFYDPTRGSVLLDGVSLKEYKLDAIRDLMGIVSQESILFNDTVFNNIAFGAGNVTTEAVIKAAEIANAQEFILKLENGYQTEIGERGSKLSGGQRQRLSIARAVLKNPPILILDEATSALDSESENLVQEALSNLMKNRTSIVIAHRLSTIQNADEIIVLQQGRILERGTHHQLLDQGGLYKKLNAMQAV